jgi:hypothetical protein
MIRLTSMNLTYGLSANCGEAMVFVKPALALAGVNFAPNCDSINPAAKARGRLSEILKKELRHRPIHQL